MKGSIANCLKEVVIQGYGTDKWEELRVASNLPRVLLDSGNISDEQVITAFNMAPDVLGITWQKLMDAFAEHWTFNYASKLGYGFFLKKHKSAREAILDINRVHQMATANIKGATPPTFDFKWDNDNTLCVEYKSHRGLFDICLACLKALGKYYNEDLKITKAGNNKIRIEFAAQSALRAQER
jgi:hypothetical protein